MLGVGVLTVIKRLMIPNYPEFAVSRDSVNFSLQGTSTKYGNRDDGELVREEFSINNGWEES